MANAFAKKAKMKKTIHFDFRPRSFLIGRTASPANQNAEIEVASAPLEIRPIRGRGLKKKCSAPTFSKQENCEPESLPSNTLPPN